LIDMSGSMGGATPSGESKFELLVAAVKEFLESDRAARVLGGSSDYLERRNDAPAAMT
jgi:hypothetical protein